MIVLSLKGEVPVSHQEKRKTDAEHRTEKTDMKTARTGGAKWKEGCKAAYTGSSSNLSTV